MVVLSDRIDGRCSASQQPCQRGRHAQELQMNFAEPWGKNFRRIFAVIYSPPDERALVRGKAQVKNRNPLFAYERLVHEFQDCLQEDHSRRESLFSGVQIRSPFHGSHR